MTDQRIDIKAFGTLLGSASGWDGEMPLYMFYDFVPAEGVNIPAGACMNIDYETGVVEILAKDDSTVVHTQTLRLAP